MKKLILGVLFICATSAFAEVDIRIGEGTWVCSAEGIKDYATLARSKTKAMAKFLAHQKCAEHEGNSFHCEVEVCERDTRLKNLDVEINFSIERDESNVSITLNNGQPAFVCISEAFSNTYSAEAPTRLEAEVLARQTCIADGYHGMHCDVEECEKVESEGISGRVGSGGIDLQGTILDIRGWFGR